MAFDFSKPIPPYKKTIVCEGIAQAEKLFSAQPAAFNARRYFLILDPDQKGSEALKSLPNTYFLQGGSVEALSSQLLEIFNTFSQTAWLSAREVIAEPNAAPEKYKIFHQVIENEAKFIPQLMGSSADAWMGFQYLKENIPLLKKYPGVNLLQGLYAGLPAVVVGTGPSLTKSLEQLKKLKDKALIIAADASYKILLEAGITPHFVCSLEREYDTKIFFENIAAHRPATALVAYPVVPHGVIEAFQGPKLFVYRNLRMHQYFDSQMPKGFLNSGHSVTHLAASLADYLGCSQIALIGQDLSFDPDKLSTHAENIAYEKWSEAQSLQDLEAKLKEQGDHLVWAEGNEREKVPTRGYYMIFAREFAALQKIYKAELINCTIGGLKIPRLKYQSLSETSKNWTTPSDLFERRDKILSERREPTQLNLAPLLENLRQWQALLLENAQLIRFALEGKLAAPEKQIPTLISQARGIWEKAAEDHVMQAFGIELIGMPSIQLEIDWLKENSEKPEAMKCLKIIDEFFRLMLLQIEKINAELRPLA